MLIDIISLFPEMFSGPFGHSIIKRAQDADRLKIHVVNPRDFTTDKHHIVDDYPFGGGSGMVMKPEPLFAAVEHVLQRSTLPKRRVILMCPSGSSFNQEKARQLAQYDHLVFVCGHYEGIDDRVKQHLVDEAISIGDFVLTGGELAAMVIVDAVSRMIPGVLGAADGALHDSFYSGLLEYPQYTRPREFRDWNVPDILLSGDHAKIAKWRRCQSLKKTLECRPDLLETIELSPEDAKLLSQLKNEKYGG